MRLYAIRSSQYKPGRSQGNSVANAARPTRIAFCITDLDPGGAERALVQLATRLDRGRWEPVVFCLSRPGDLVAVLKNAGISATCLGGRSAIDVGIVSRLRHEFRRFDPTIVQTFLFHANLAGRLAACWARVPWCVSGIRVAEKRARWPLWLDRLTNRLVVTNVCVSQAVMEFSAEVAGLRRDKLTVIPNGVDFASFATAAPLDLSTLGVPAGSRTLVAVGRLDRQKGLQYLISAAASLKKRHPDLHFVLVGDGPERGRLTFQASQLGLSGRIHFAGWRPDVPRVLRAASGLVLPSLW
ncbi:MAG: glycosyltransferase, partial [Planctomycetaceae bacterium]|nr:glycosyltransferase [Planctomycetaceae bacterium]